MYKKKVLLILFLVFIFLVSFTFAKDIKTYKLKENQIYEDDDHTIYYTLSASKDSILLSVDNRKVIVKNQTCKKVKKYKFCLDKIKTIEDKDLLSYHYEIDLIKKEKDKELPELEVETSLNPDKPDVKDTSTYKIKIKNTGLNDAYFDLIIDIKGNLTIKKNKFGIVKNKPDHKTYTITKYIKINETLNYDLEIMPLKYEKIKINSIIKYFKEKNEKIEKTNEFTNEFPNEVTLDLESSADIGKKSRGKLKLKNKINEETFFKVEVKVPNLILYLPSNQNYKIYNKTEFKKYFFYIQLNNKKEYEFDQVFKCIKKGKYNIKYNVTSIIDKNKEQFNFEKEISCEIDEPELKFTLPVKDIYLKNSFILVNLKAPETFDLYKVNAILKSDLFKNKKYYTYIIQKHREENLFSFQFKPNITNNSKKHKIKLIYDYEDIEGNHYINQEEKEIEYCNPNSAIKIISKPKKLKLKKGEEILIEVFGKLNCGMKYDKINIKDILPRNIKWYGFIEKKDVYLKSSEEKLYSYKIKIPDNYNKSELNIITNYITKYFNKTINTKLKIQDTKINSYNKKPEIKKIIKTEQKKVNNLKKIETKKEIKINNSKINQSKEKVSNNENLIKIIINFVKSFGTKISNK
jgi:hypothetical protein